MGYQNFLRHKNRGPNRKRKGESNRISKQKRTK